MIETEKTVLENYTPMIKDAFLSLSLIIGGNMLRLRIDHLLEQIHQFSDPNSANWELLLKSTSWVSMVIGSLVGCTMLYNFISDKVKNHKITKRNK